MINRIIGILNSTGGISDWRITSTRTESTELFFVHRDLETVRSTDTTATSVTVYSEHDGALGSASFSVYSSYDDERIAAEVKKAVSRAALISNQPYSLPENEVGEYSSDSNFADYAPAKLASEIANACFEADCVEGGSINALEIFIYKDTRTVRNSRGINKTHVGYRAMVEAIPTFSMGESVELYEQYNFTEFDHDRVRDEIATKMWEVRNRHFARKPLQTPTCPVVLGAPELNNLLSEMAWELNFSNVYQHMNAFSVGDEIQKNAIGDKLGVTVCAEVKGSVRSAAFDSDGTTLVDRKVIDGGRAVALWGSTRFAQYLGEEPTGDLGCIKADLGTLTDDELRSKPYFRCASMSGLQLDIDNDYIGGEVRLAYYFDGEREMPLTGISISGKLSAALSSIRFSNEATTYEGYNGPKLALVEGVEIV